MLSGSKRFDLYDFFSVLLPGTILILGFIPFLPSKGNFTSFGAVLPLLAAGFVVGRAIHSAAVIIEKRHKDEPKNAGLIRKKLIYPVIALVFAHDWSNDVTHRRKFKDELTNPSDVDDQVVEAFLESFRDIFEDEISMKKSLK